MELISSSKCSVSLLEHSYYTLYDDNRPRITIYVFSTKRGYFDGSQTV